MVELANGENHVKIFHLLLHGGAIRMIFCLAFFVGESQKRGFSSLPNTHSYLSTYHRISHHAVVLDTPSEGPDRLFVQIKTVFVQIATKYT